MTRPWHVVSLSHVHDPATTPIYPGDPAFTIDTVATIERDGYHLQRVSAGEHTGTHWGAPAHFEPGGLTADRLDPDDLLLPAVRIDVRGRCEIGVSDVERFELEHGPIPLEAAVVFWTGWESHWGTAAYTSGPGIGVATVEWLIDRGILGRRGAIGIDTFGPDVDTDTTYAASRLLYREHRISLENLANLAALPPTGAWILAGGPLNRNGSGSTATIFALLPDQ